MKTLIVEDDVISRFMLKDFLSPYGNCDTVGNGSEALQAFRIAVEKNEPYDLICMDIMMPIVDGQEAIRQIRNLEKEKGIKASAEVKVIMITSVDDPKIAMDFYYKGGADSYIVKPVKKQKLIDELRILGLIK